MNIREITTQDAAYSLISEQRLNSLHSELETLVFASAEAVSKIDALCRPHLWSQLTQDQQFTLLTLKSDLLKKIDLITEANKKI